MYSASRSSIRSWNRSPIRFIKRAFSDKGEDPSILLREVMRNVAQPVAIAVTSVPETSPLYGKARYHGATLTSFTSLTLYPHPLVAFSLRLPSRMADCLRPYRTHSDHQQQQRRNQQPSQGSSSSPTTNPSNNRLQEEAIMNGSLESTSTPPQSKGITLPPKSELPWPLSKLPMPEQPPEWAKSLFAQIPNPLIDESTSNPLSSASATFAQNAPSSSFPSYPPPPSSPSSSSESLMTPPKQIITTHPTPLTISLLSKSNEKIADSLSLPRTDHSTIFAMKDTWSEHSTHPPSLKDSLGALQCEIVGSVLLKDLCGSASADSDKGEGSELFICRVIGVDMPSVTELKGNQGQLDDIQQPLLHWRRKYVGIKEAEEDS